MNEIMRQNAREIAKIQRHAELDAMTALVEINRDSNLGAYRVALLYTALEKLLKVVVAGEAPAAAKVEAAEILSAIDRSLGRPEKHAGLLRIPKETK